MFKQFIDGLKENFKDSLSWLSVQVTAAWGTIWVIYSQLPHETMEWLYTHNIPAYMGIAQTTMTYMARVKKPKDPQ